MQAFLYWLPRVITIIYTVLASLFAFDIYKEGYNYKEDFLMLVPHLLPTIILILFVYIAWKKPLIGGLLFIAVGAAYTILAWSRFPPLTIGIIAGPLFFAGLLYLLQGKQKKQDSAVHIQGEKTDITQMT